MKDFKADHKPDQRPIKLLKNPDVTEKQFLDARAWYLSAQNKDISNINQKSSLLSDA
jgi:hypothetical protein